MISYEQAFRIRVERAKLEMERAATCFAKFDNKHIADACDGEIEDVLITAGALMHELDKVIGELKRVIKDDK